MCQYFAMYMICCGSVVPKFPGNFTYNYRTMDTGNVIDFHLF